MWKLQSVIFKMFNINLNIILNIAGTAAYATDSSSAAAKSEVEGENKSTDDDDKGGKYIIYRLQK